MQNRSPRFPIQRPVAFRLKAPGKALEGSGQTVNISSGGVLFETEGEISVGRKIELVVEIGDALGGPPVSMHVQGITLRSRDGAVAVQIKKHKLRPLEPAPEAVSAANQPS